MDNKLFFEDVVDLVSQKGQISHDDAKMFLEKLFGVVSQFLSQERRVEIDELGTFEVEPAREVNSEELCPKISFTPSVSLKEAVNKPFAHFEKVLLNDGVVLEGIAVEDNGEFAIVAEIEADISSADVSLEVPTLEPTPEASNLPPEHTPAEQEVIAETIDVVPPAQSQEGETPQVIRSIAVLPMRRKAPKIPAIAIPILGGVAIALASLFFFVPWQKPITSPITPDKDDAEMVISMADPVAEAAPQAVMKIPETVVLSGGKTLRILAEEKFGNRDFWVYIYLKNRNKISNPNRIPAGIELVIPFPEEYNINASSAESVANAKLLGEEQLKRF